MGELQMDCPFCGKEKHLYFNAHKQVYHCFRCGSSGHASQLRAYGIAVENDHDVLLHRDVSYRVAEGLEDPPTYSTLSTSSVGYLTERGVHDSVLRLLRSKIYDTAKGLLFFYPTVDYWQERRWGAFSPPRWVNPSVAPSSPGTGVTYHLRTHFDSDRVVLVEGIMDALRVAPYANVAAMLSSKYHESQLLALYDEGYRSVTALPDNDVSVTARLHYLFKLRNWFAYARVWPALTTGDDPGSATDEELKDVAQSPLS